MLTKEFILAGKALFTVEIPAMIREGRDYIRPHYTFKVVRKDATARFPESFLILLLTGANNETDFSYVGMLCNGSVRLTKASRYTDDTYPVKLLRRVLERLWAGNGEAITAAGFNVHHEGRCGRCSRLLTVPSSIASGFGPECIKHA